MAEDDDTPVLKPRRPSASITSWGIIAAWLTADPENRRTGQVIGPQGFSVIVTKNANEWVLEVVAPHEDPSAAIMRGISKL